MLNRAFCFALLFVFFLPFANADLITNGGFETGDFTGWTQSGWFIDSTNLHSGVYDASTGCAGLSCTAVGNLNSAYLYQTVATTPGATYTLSFFYNSGQLPTTASELLVLWGNPNAPSLSTVVDLLNVNTSAAYVHYTATLAATSAMSQLEFLGRQDLQFYSLDDVSLTGGTTSSAPEPSSWFLIVTIACLMCALALAKSTKAKLPLLIEIKAKEACGNFVVQRAFLLAIYRSNR